MIGQTIPEETLDDHGKNDDEKTLDDHEKNDDENQMLFIDYAISVFSKNIDDSLNESDF